MELRLEKSFDGYFASAQETERVLISSNIAAVRGLRRFHCAFHDALWPGSSGVPPTAGVLCMNAYLIFLSGAHSALQEHTAAVFPLVRTALENACYAFLIAKDPSLEGTWVNRHRDEQSRRASRAAFTTAVRKTTDAINALQPQSGDFVMESYEAAIDDGAHPNPRGVMRHIRVAPADEDGRVAMSLTALHGPNDFQTQRGLVACLDFAWAIGLVMARTPPALTGDAAGALVVLNAAKEDALREFGFALPAT